MIMMDVSMYGHNSTPSYNPTDTNYYNYGNGSSDHSMAPHHQYTGGSAGSYSGGAGYHGGTTYEEATYLYGGASNDSGVETPPSPQEPHFYTHLSNPPDTSIINTETGLSYTNLDYANSNSSVYHQPGYSEDAYPGRPPHDMLLRHHDDSSDANYQYLHDSKYHPHQLDEGSYHHHPHIISPGQTNVACMEFQQLQSRYKEEMLGSDGRMRQPHGMHPMSGGQPQHPVLPTYKWMQVKRNIPKPTASAALTALAIPGAPPRPQ